MEFQCSLCVDPTCDNLNSISISANLCLGNINIGLLYIGNNWYNYKFKKNKIKKKVRKLTICVVIFGKLIMCRIIYKLRNNFDLNYLEYFSIRGYDDFTYIFVRNCENIISYFLYIFMDLIDKCASFGHAVSI